MQAISVKELRTKFPFIRSELKKGKSFLIIYKSKPIAELKPTNTNGMSSYEEASDEDIEQAAVHDANKFLDDDWLSEEEVKYYMSLPPLP